MRVLRNLLYRDIIAAVGYVTLAFLALFFFFDLVDELRWVGRGGDNGYQITHALLFVVLRIPSHLYELMPITVLIGTIYVMGLGFVLATFGTGDYLAPAAENAGQNIRAIHLAQLSRGATGAWLKERQADHSIAINVRAIRGPGDFANVRIFDFDGQGRIAAQIHAESAQVNADDGSWTLRGVQASRLTAKGDGGMVLMREKEDSLDWKTEISAEMVSAALLKPDRMSTISLFQYVRHLEANGQAAQKYEIEFWRKVFYPMSCLVMVVLALPFAYLHFRSGGIAAYVFGGVMAGISFFLLNNVFGYIGTLQTWSPWLTAAAPGLLYSLLSLTAFTWLVLRR
jgi:lipopolysaccharide export system permease protein